LKQASRNKNSFASHTLAQLYEIGFLVELDYSKAIEYYKKCTIELTPSPSYCAIRLGEIYEYGIGGTAVDYQQAMQWYLKAYHPDGVLATNYGAFEISRLYGLGRGVKQDYNLMANWLLKAIVRFPHNGHKIATGFGASCALAIIYSNGLVVPKDVLETKYWLNPSVGIGAFQVCEQMKLETK
jgi:TPR repeat protein